MQNKYPENDYRNYLSHSAKGKEWDNHKYLYKTPSGRYVYPEDVANGVRNVAGKIGSAGKSVASKTKNALSGLKNQSLNIGRSAGAKANVIGNKVSKAAGNTATKAKFKLRKERIAAKKTVSNLYGRTKDTLNVAGNKASKAIGNTTTKAKFKARKARIGAKKNASSLYNRALGVLDVTRQKAGSRLHSATTSAKTAVGNAKAKARTLKRNATEALTNRKAKGSLKSRAKIAIKQFKERNTNGVSDYTWYGKDEKAKKKAKKQSNRVYSPSTKQHGTLRYRGEYSSRKSR